jgi:hypothetical protein
LVAISRTEDYRHHWQDVSIGALLGTLCAYFAYRQYYPGLSQDACRDPFLTRVAYCKRGYDIETGIIVVDTTTANNGGPLKYQLDGYDESNSSIGDNHLEHTNSRIPLVGRSNDADEIHQH